MTGEPVTTLFDYQLAMLHAMCSSAPAQAADLLDRIGATHADTAAADKRWWSSTATNNFQTISEYVTAWGPPSSENLQVHGKRSVLFAYWDLPFWPGFQIELMGIPGGPRRVFRRLLRKPGIPQPRLDSVVELIPWSCTQAELLNSDLGPFDEDIDLGPIGNRIDFAAVDPASGRTRTYRAQFDWGLLQSVEPVLVRLGKRGDGVVPDADERSIDELILAGQTYRAIKKIMAEQECGGSEAIDELQRRYARLASERPNDFLSRTTSED